MEERKFPKNLTARSPRNTYSMRHKEKRRTESLNKAFCELRKCIPHVPCDTKLSKIKTLQLASSYINHLSTLLKTSSSGNKCDIVSNVPLSIPQKKNMNYVLNVKAIPIKSSCIPKSQNPSQMKKAKGRTGWPETVWAETLECASSCSNKSFCETVSENHLSTVSENGLTEKKRIFNFHYKDVQENLGTVSSTENISNVIINTQLSLNYPSKFFQSDKCTEPLPSISTLGLKARSTCKSSGNSFNFHPDSSINFYECIFERSEDIVIQDEEELSYIELQPALYYTEENQKTI